MTDPSPAAASSSRPPTAFEPVSFSELPGWRQDDHAAAFSAFLRSAQAISAGAPKSRAVPGDALMLPAERALGSGARSRDGARAFFETEFRAFRIRPASGGGFFTGYYEPEVIGSRVRTGNFTVPLYRRPDDLVDGAPYHDRQAIESGALAGRGLEIAWLESPVDAFFIHVQGSARVGLTDGSLLRLSYAGKSGHAYTPIGRMLRERGALPAGGVTVASIRAWLAAHPDEAPATMWNNRSFIFFRETEGVRPEDGPIAAAGVPLTTGRSLAVDRAFHTFHSPVFVEATLPGGSAFRRLTIAQDTGSAIVGPARGDIFFGTGDQAGAVAGAMQAEGRFYLLAPAGVLPEVPP
jgi:membrane-bound lytic murein transglycosylase A